MARPVRIATYNVENLFSRAKVLNFANPVRGDQLLAKVGELNGLLERVVYDAQIKRRIFALYQELKAYIDILELREKLFKYQGLAKAGIQASGRGAWEGGIAFQRDRVLPVAQRATGKIIRDANADVACLIEVESRPYLQTFSSDQLTGQHRYPYNMLIDGNDTRGIDVSIVSRLPVKRVRTHIFDTVKNKPKSRVFSRDCLEVELDLGGGRALHVLVNHFKSKGWSGPDAGSGRRQQQAARVAEILGGYNLKTDYVVVAGDLNDTPDSKGLKPLLKTRDLHDVLALQFGASSPHRWTYEYEGNLSQIDYVLVSTALRQRFRAAGVIRSGIWDIQKFTLSGERMYSRIKQRKDAASDHGLVWAEFAL